LSDYQKGLSAISENYHRIDERDFKLYSETVAGNKKQVLTLLEQGADPNIPYKPHNQKILILDMLRGSAESAFIIAVKKGHYEIVKAMLDTERVTQENKNKALFYVVRTERYGDIKLLLKHGADPNARYEGTTAFIIAASLQYAGPTSLMINSDKKPSENDQCEALAKSIHNETITALLLGKYQIKRPLLLELNPVKSSYFASLMLLIDCGVDWSQSLNTQFVKDEIIKAALKEQQYINLAAYVIRQGGDFSKLVERLADNAEIASLPEFQHITWALAGELHRKGVSPDQVQNLAIATMVKEYEQGIRQDPTKYILRFWKNPQPSIKYVKDGITVAGAYISYDSLYTKRAKLFMKEEKQKPFWTKHVLSSRQAVLEPGIVG
jgi:hypothetical protein